MTAGPWQQRAACAHADPDLFTATSRTTAAAALAICAGCPVTRECWLIRGPRGELPGVWGGRVYDEHGHEQRPPVPPPTVRGVVGVCTACGRDVSARGREREACPDPMSLCRQTARSYHASRYEHDRKRKKRARIRAREGTAA